MTLLQERVQLPVQKARRDENTIDGYVPPIGNLPYPTR